MAHPAHIRLEVGHHAECRGWIDQDEAGHQLRMLHGHASGNDAAHRLAHDHIPVLRAAVLAQVRSHILHERLKAGFACRRFGTHLLNSNSKLLGKPWKLGKRRCVVAIKARDIHEQRLDGQVRRRSGQLPAL